jgi:hypothetical protein
LSYCFVLNNWGLYVILLETRCFGSLKVKEFL